MELFSTARFAFEDEQWADMAEAHPTPARPGPSALE